MNYYNENDPYPAAWLRNLIEAGLIPPGDVDERDIRDVRAGDLAGYTQCHFFAGVGGWSRALGLAGYPDDRFIWTASCPCPPFSVAGKRQKCPECESTLLVWCPRRTGFAICAACGHAWLADARHLWPEVWRLAAERRPELIIGEQVASHDALDWLAGVRASLEILGYAVGAADLPAACVAAPHIRQRLWWVADTSGERRGETRRDIDRSSERVASERETGGLDNPTGPRHPPARGGEQEQPEGRRGMSRVGCEAGWLGEPQSVGRVGRQDDSDQRRRECTPGPSGEISGMGDADDTRPQGRIERGNGAGQRTVGAPGVGFWSDFALIPCGDGKTRRVPQSALLGLADGVSAGMDGLPPEEEGFPLAQGVERRVGAIRAFGNAIVPPLAAEFIKAVMDDS